MNKQNRVGHPMYSLLPTEVEGFDSLAELALDMRWSWIHCADEVWRQLDPALWELTVRVIRTDEELMIARSVCRTFGFRPGQ